VKNGFSLKHLTMMS